LIRHLQISAASHPDLPFILGPLQSPGKDLVLFGERVRERKRLEGMREK